MSTRPMFWIHRTRLFWFGLGVSIVLTGVTLVICQQSISVSYSQPGASSSHGFTIGLRRGGVYAMHSEVDLRWVRTRPGMSPSRWSFSTREHPGLDWWPEVDVHNREYVFIPLWPFLALWCFLWPWWMHRSEKKMVERHRKRGG